MYFFVNARANAADSADEESGSLEISRECNAIGNELQKCVSRFDELKSFLNEANACGASAEEITISSDSNNFKSEFAGYSFELPSGYIISRLTKCDGWCSEILNVHQKKDELAYIDMAISISATDFHNSENFEKWKSQQENSKDIFTGKTIIGGEQAAEYEIPGIVGAHEYRFSRENYFYVISVEKISPDPAAQMRVAEKIISTLKFAGDE